jgi:glycosyltransferase involved in cell wall biosynthesis
LRRLKQEKEGKIMNILYDYQIFSLQRYGGISRYFCELIEEFSKQSNVNTLVSLQNSENYYLNNIYNNLNDSFLSKYNYKGKERILPYINKVKSIYEIKKGKYDIFHPTYYDTYYLKHIGKKPFVLTVYDMIHELYKEQYDSNETIERKKILLEKATKIIAISESTKKDIINLYNIPEEKIEVIYLSSSLQVKKDVVSDKLDKLPKRYILFVGARSGYKNFDLFLRAITPLLVKDKNLKLVCAGGGNFTDGENAILAKLKIEEEVTQITVEDDELGVIYSKAEVFVYPSMYEGFGIPILEAFNCNCPVALSDSSSFPEVAGKAAIYFDPKVESSIRDSVEKVINNKEFQSELREKGKIQAEKFTWKLTAEKTMSLYRGLV